MSATLVRPACPLCECSLVFEGTRLAGCEGGCDPDRIRGDLGWPVPAPAAATNGQVAAGEPPPLSELLDELAGFVRRFVVMSPAQTDVAAVWIAHSHTIEAAEQTPYISITSAEKRSGKTRLLEVFELLVARPWLTGRVTAAVLARKVDAERPTLLLDESDAAFKSEKEYAEALRGLLNTGHRRGGKSTVCVGQGAEIGYKDFSTFCAKAIAGIGRLPDTVADRSLAIRLERRAPGEHAERFRRRDAEGDALVLRHQLERLAELAPRLQAAHPDLPTALDDRAQDAAEPLLAIADLAGGDWPARARAALIELHGGREVEDESTGVRLLNDVKTVFGADEDRLPSTVLLERLANLDEAPWRDWYGKPLTTRGLARLLAPYGIRSRQVRFEEGTAGTKKGFLRDQFKDAWDRYLPSTPVENRHSDTTRIDSGLEADSGTTQETFVSELESAANPHGERVVSGVSDAEPGGPGVTPRKARPPVPAIALAESDAAAALAMGATFFRENVMPDLRSIRIKGKTLYPVAELERWAAAHAGAVLPHDQGGHRA